jgi:hypothetical protein
MILRYTIEFLANFSVKSALRRITGLGSIDLQIYPYPVMRLKADLTEKFAKNPIVYISKSYIKIKKT